MLLKIIDSSTLPLNLTNHKWAKFRKTKAGVKLHLRLVFMNKETVYLEKAVITTAKEHDRNQLEILVDDIDDMYVFDRGYVLLSAFLVVIVQGTIMLLPTFPFQTYIGRAFVLVFLALILNAFLNIRRASNK